MADMTCVTYENRFWQLVWFLCWHQFSSWAMQLINGVLPVLFIIFWQDWLNPTKAVFLGIGLYCVIWLLQVLFNAVYVLSRKDKCVLTTHTITLTDTALCEETPYNRSEFYWHSVEKVFERGGFLMIYISKNFAFIIPKEAFALSEDKIAFIDEINQRRQTAML